MSIVHWGKYYPPDMGGIESVTDSLARAAVAVGHAVTVVCFHKGPPAGVVQPDGVRVLRAPMLAKSASQPLGWRYLLWCLREGRSGRLVHLHAPNMLAALAVGLLGKRPRLVVHWHSDVVGKGLLGRMLAPLETMMLRRADIVVCTSEAYANASKPLRPFSHKVRVVPIGMPDLAGTGVDSAGPLPKELDERVAGRRIVLAVGRLVSYKGFDVLVGAAKQMAPDAVVIIVGTGPLHSELQGRIDSAALGERVILAGRQNDAALRALFQRAELFCLPSVERSEAFGVVLVEAMSYGLPVVTTQIPGSGVPWVNEHGVSGLNVPTGDAAALALACNQIMSDSDFRERLSRGARMRFEKEFTEEKSWKRVMVLYEQLLGRM